MRLRTLFRPCCGADHAVKDLPRELPVPLFRNERSELCPARWQRDHRAGQWPLRGPARL